MKRAIIKRRQRARTQVQVRVCEIDTPHGKFTRFAYVETTIVDGALVGVRNMPDVFNTIHEAVHAARQIADAADLPVIQLQKDARTIN